MLLARPRTILAFGLAGFAPGFGAHATVGLPVLPTIALDAAGAPETPSTRRLPPLDKLVLPEEQPQLAALIGALRGPARRDPGLMLSMLDQILVDLPKPTKLRGVVQMIRAFAFEAMDRHQEAIAAIDEAIRLLPEDPGPRIAAATIHLYSNDPGLAADDILRASSLDPRAVLSLKDYEVDGLMHRLDGVRDHKRARQLSERLLALGWTGTGVRSRSELAKAAIQSAVEDGDLARARQLVPLLLDPGASYALLSLKAYQPIWGDIEAFAGPKLKTQWRAYLDEARNRWETGRDMERGADYAAALRSAGANDRLIATFLPLFDGGRDAQHDWSMLFIAPKLASALMSQGRGAEALSMYDLAAQTWPLGSSANALNLAANRANALLYSDRPAEALAQIDLAIQDSHRWPGEVNSDAIAKMHGARACILYALGRAPEAAISATIAAEAGHQREEARVALCRGDLAAARGALIKGLKFPEERPDIVDFMQPSGEPIIPTKYGRSQRAAEDALRRDPLMLAALEPYGRIMAYAENEAAPK